jgi:hypothetical protein
MRIIHATQKHKSTSILAAVLLCAVLLALLFLLAMPAYAAGETVLTPPTLNISVAAQSDSALPEDAELTAVPLPVMEGDRTVPSGVVGDADFLYETLVSGDVTVLDVNVRTSDSSVNAAADATDISYVPSEKTTQNAQNSGGGEGITP